MSLKDKREVKEAVIINEDLQIFDYSFKLLIIGNAGVGKSCLTLRATKNIFEENCLSTIGFEFFSLNIKIDQKLIKLQIWDTCGQEQYRSLISSFYKNSSLAILVYSITDRKSFEELSYWVKELKLHSSPNIKLVLIGNKSDLANEREVTKEEAEEFSFSISSDIFLETSAKTGDKVNELFIESAKILYADYLQYCRLSASLNDSKERDDTVNTYEISKVLNSNIIKISNKNNDDFIKEKNKTKCCK